MPLSGAGMLRGVKPALRQQLRTELLAALANSRVMEHALRLRLALQQHAGPGAEDAAARVADVAGCVDVYLSAVTSRYLASPWYSAPAWSGHDATWVPPPPPESAPALRSILTGPCLQLYLGWRLAAPLSAAAGRPLYGMPASLMQFSPAAGADVSDPDRIPLSDDFCAAVCSGSLVWGRLLEGAPTPARAAPPGQPPGAGDASNMCAATSAAASQPRLPYRVREVAALLSGALQMEAWPPSANQDLVHALDGLLYFYSAAQPFLRPATMDATLPLLWRRCLAALDSTAADMECQEGTSAAAAPARDEKFDLHVGVQGCVGKLLMMRTAATGPAAEGAGGGAAAGRHTAEGEARSAEAGVSSSPAPRSAAVALAAAPCSPADASARQEAVAAGGAAGDARTSQPGAAGGAALGAAPAVAFADRTGPPAPPMRPSPTLAAALDAGLVPTMERMLRAAGWDTVSAAVDFILRRPGAWPALLAHGPPSQVASLIVTLRKQLRRISRRLASGHLTASGLGLHLNALLEQAAAAVDALAAWEQRPGGGGGGGGAAAALPRGSLGAALAARSCRQLQLNRSLSGHGAATAAASGQGQDGGDARLVRGPSWEDIERAGGCPPPGSPAAQQLKRLALFAATQWLPALLVPMQGAGAQTVTLSSLVVPGQRAAHLPPLRWLLLAAREFLAADVRRREAPPRAREQRAEAEAAHLAWNSFFLQADVVYHVADAALLAAPAGAAPTLDLLEMLVALMPDVVARTVQSLRHMGHFAGSGAAGLDPMGPRFQALLRQQRREALLAALDHVEAMARGAGHAPRRGGGFPGADGLVAAHVAAGAAAPTLPLPCSAAEALQGACAHMGCEGLEGPSEAGRELPHACGQCGGARFCSAECLRAHRSWVHGRR